MKKLIYTLTLLTFPLFGVFAIDEIASPDTGKQIVSVVKDIQVQKLLEQTSEFAECRKLNEKPDADRKVQSDNLKKAQDCFAKKLGNEKDPKKLKELAETLNLQQYGLVQSNNVKSIQKYLSDKMYQSLTGVDPNEPDLKKLTESLKFKNKKQVDQKIFADMFKTQLGKNALHEVSRFCFENLRLPPPATPAGATAQTQAPTSFAEYWKDYKPQNTFLVPNTAKVIDVVNDSGEPKFGKMSDPTDKKKVFEDIFTSIQGASNNGMKEEYMSDFFLECGKLIVPLCESFKTSTSSANLSTNETKVDEGKNGLTVGAAACLAKSRIQDYKLAMKNADLVVQQFRTMSAEDQQSLVIGLDKGQVPKIFGNQPEDESIDDLTNNTATDIFEAGLSEDEKIKKAAEKCNSRAELSECEAFISKGDGLENAKHGLEMEMTLKRETEMARVRLLVAGDQQELTEYLESNGHFDIVKEMKNGKSYTPDQMATIIGESFEAKKQAVLQQINNKLGKRQVSEKTSDAAAVAAADEVVKDSKEERSRLAQVVMFNNVITSHLTLSKEVSKGKYEEVGRNVNAWKKEENALKDSQVDPKFFQNLKERAAGKDGIGKDSEIAGFQLLDEILGKEKP